MKEIVQRMPKSYYTHAQASSSSVDVNVNGLLHRIEGDYVEVSLKEITLVVSLTGTATQAVLIGDIAVSNQALGMNLVSTAGAPTLLHTFGANVVAGKSNTYSNNLSSDQAIKLVISKTNLLTGGGLLTVSAKNLATYGDTITTTVSVLEVVLEIKEVDSN